jgi:hypothetical protein
MVLALVLEAMLSWKEALKHPFFMLVASCLICSVSLWVAFLSFPKSASILSIAFVTIALVPLFHSVFKHEEESEAERPGFYALFLARHFNVVKVYAFFFLGMILTYAFWYSVVPIETRNLMFAEQEATLGSINNLRETLTGNFSLANGGCGTEAFCWFSVIVSNNVFNVLFPALVLSFIYGAGAIFLIGWNASVLGVLIGKDIVFYAASHGGAAALFVAINRFFSLFPHGLFESLGYFVGAIAGGIIGAAVTKKRHLRGELGTITKDVVVMLLYAIGLLVVGGIIEAYAIVSAIA